MQKPIAGTYPVYYDNYIAKINSNDALQLLEENLSVTRNFFVELPLEKENFRYAEGKWSVKEVFGHMIDTERIMGMRALCIARGEQAPLPGFDENTYVENADFNARSMKSLIDEFTFLRQSHLALFHSFNAEMLDRTGNANGKNNTPRAIIWMIAGHEIHHLGVIKDRYLQS